MALPNEEGGTRKMRYLGVARKKNSVLKMPIQPMTTEEIERLARETIDAHRKTLEALAR